MWQLAVRISALETVDLIVTIFSSDCVVMDYLTHVVCVLLRLARPGRGSTADAGRNVRI